METHLSFWSLLKTSIAPVCPGSSLGPSQTARRLVKLTQYSANYAAVGGTGFGTVAREEGDVYVISGEKVDHRARRSYQLTRTRYGQQIAPAGMIGVLTSSAFSAELKAPAQMYEAKWLSSSSPARTFPTTTQKLSPSSLTQRQSATRQSTVLMFDSATFVCQKPISSRHLAKVPML